MSEEERADFNPADRMIKLSGKEYLQVADRIVWFRNECPEGSIETIIVSIDEERGSAIFRAEVCTGKGGRATATGSETLRDFPQGWIEKAEAKAVGRALGYLGFGTASAGFEEGQRIVDAPQQATPTRAPARRSDPPTNLRPAAESKAAAGTPADQEALVALLTTIRNDLADQKVRKRALHDYFGAATTIGGLNVAADNVAQSGLPEADRTAAYKWHHKRLAEQLAPASIAG